MKHVTAKEEEAELKITFEKGEIVDVYKRQALTLYLDFINLFLYLLRIFGSSNKE